MNLPNYKYFISNDFTGLLDEISIYFYVYGLREDNWHDFQKDVNYEAFLIKRK